VIDRYFDSEEFFRFWAAESLINLSDGYAGNLNNFYLYHNPTTGKFVFIPGVPIRRSTPVEASTVPKVIRNR